MAREDTPLEELRLTVETAEGVCRVVAHTSGGPMTLAESLPPDVAERLAATWNFCDGFSAGALRQTSLHALLDGMD